MCVVGAFSSAHIQWQSVPPVGQAICHVGPTYASCMSKAPFGRASPAASQAASGEALPNVCFGTGFTCEAGPKAISGLHMQGEAMKSWLHTAYTSI